MYMSMGKRHDYRQAPHRVEAPVLVVRGELDLQAEKADRLYAECFPNSSFEVVRVRDISCAMSSRRRSRRSWTGF